MRLWPAARSRAASPGRASSRWGRRKQLQRFVEQVAAQPFGLSRISDRIRLILKNLLLESLAVRTSRRNLQLGERSLIMGILNVTPDSFSDGGRFASSEMA